MDHKLPHDELRVRVHGSTLVAQPYDGMHRYGNPLLIDLDTGNIALGAKMIDLTTDYLTVRAIFGVQRLRHGVAVPVATAAEAAATVNGQTVYRITKCLVLTSHGKVPADKSDKQLVALLRDVVSPHGIGAGLYFATGFNITCATQVARTSDGDKPLWQRSCDNFWFNAQLSEPLCHAGAHQYVMPAILGFVKQFSGLELTRKDVSQALSLTLIARRGRFRAGTRHWRRGIDGQGNVANFVETEQIAETGQGELTAYVQLRGSIPVCWSQVPNTRYKPPTVISDDSAASFGAFSRHAKALAARYGAVTAINLCNGHGSEGKLCGMYRAAAEGLPRDTALSLVAFDFHKECGKVNYENLSKLWEQVEPAARGYGALRVGGELGSVSGTQRGVLRTNCVDCLDRTNVAQAYFARKQLEGLLRALGLLGHSEAIADEHPALEQRFRVLWADHGDALSQQYAGTGALKAGFTRTGKRTAFGMADDGVKSAVRYYLNNYEDGRKQDAYDLVCGTFKPRAAPLDTMTKRRASGAAWVLLAFLLVSTALLTLVLAPISRRISVLRTTLPMLGAGLLAFGAVLGMGGKVVCWPALRPDLVQPWLQDGQQANGKKAA